MDSDLWHRGNILEPLINTQDGSGLTAEGQTLRLTNVRVVNCLLPVAAAKWNEDVPFLAQTSETQTFFTV